MKKNIVLSVMLIIGLIFSFSNCTVDKVKLNRMFVDAAKKGNLIELKKLFNKGADINVIVKYGQNAFNALIWASKNNHFEIIKFLVEHGADINSGKNSAVNTPLINAVRSKRFDIVKYFISHGADVNIKLIDNSTALIDAVYPAESFEIVQFLVERGADVNAMNNYGQTPLNWAARMGYLEIVKYLVSKGADVNLRRDDASSSALMDASENNNIEVVRFLLRKGANPEFQDYKGYTALITASIKGYFEIVKLLVSKGANINAKDFQGATALKHAIWNNRRNIAAYLRSVGAR